jgi:L-methionine (R)-S-oxide reductase
MDATLQSIHALATAQADRVHRARSIAESIRAARGFHWVGLYDVTASRVEAIAWTGGMAPAHPTFPVARGLTGAAIAAGEPLIVQDVSRDPRYLQTFAASRAEAIFPVIVDGAVVGTLDVESDRVNAFTAEHSQFLRACTEAIAPLWVDDVIDEI